MYESFTLKVECTDSMAKQDVLDLYRDHALRLADFLGDANDELLTQLRQLKQQTDFQLLFLWGAPAVGKSHLLQGLCADFHDAGKSSVYVPLDLPEVAPDLLSGLEHLDLVCLDNVDSRLGQLSWEDAIFHLFNRLRERRASLVMSAQSAPRQTAVTLADLKSRLSWGLAYQVNPLPLQLRSEFLNRQARLRGIELSDAVLNYISSHCARDMASLLSLLDQLDRHSLQQQRRITVPFVKQILESEL